MDPPRGGRVVGKLRIGAQKGLCRLLSLFQKGHIAGEIRHLQGRQAVLASAKEVAGTAKAQILLGVGLIPLFTALDQALALPFPTLFEPRTLFFVPIDRILFQSCCFKRAKKKEKHKNIKLNKITQRNL